MGKVITIHKSYKDLDSLKEHLVQQAEEVTFVFPNTLSDEYIKEIKENKSRLHPGCGCTSYSIQPELNQITFVVTAPVFSQNIGDPFLKSVMPKFKSELGNEIIWDIKFFVNPSK